MRKDDAPVWPSLVRASLALALTAGFGLGGALFALPALGLPSGLWWPAAAQAHGHAQLFGWAGLMVLGVGLHFLPRLRGAPLAHPGTARVALGLLVAGLALRLLAQPALALVPSRPAALRVGLVASGLLELLGASLTLWLLAETARRGPASRDRTGFVVVLPLLLSAFAALWLALAASLTGLAAAASAGGAVVPGWADGLTVEVAYYGFRVPVSVAMSARTFPLYFQTPLPDLRALRVGPGLLVVGLAARATGEVAGLPLAAGLGRLGLAVALGAFVLGLGVFAPRRPLPRRPVRPLADPIQLHALAAYAWLVVAGALLLLTGLDALGVAVPTYPLDAEQHALGAGFVTLLILGVGAHLLPGFANRPLHDRRLLWWTLALGNAAALLRVGPTLASGLLPSALASASLAAAGLAGLAAVVLFGLNLPAPRLPRASRDGEA